MNAIQTTIRYNAAAGQYEVPLREELRKFRLVIATCSFAVLVYRQALGRNHFTHIFIDEAGHSVEPECIIPLACMAGPATVVVLAGDHQQLGPVVRSPPAIRHGLATSLLERLCSLSFYSAELPDGSYRGLPPAAITKLVKNYR
jgi:helicase MOV-10